ncbi:MAG TPA: protein kinase, partial [Pyrinomonadaceae bacterium]|nr:protein kinase [Pyrinomonadaceae bacterium]
GGPSRPRTFEAGVSLLTPEVISHYRILRMLDRGGMGEVFLAEDTKLGRPLALKLLLSEFTRDPRRVGRFGQEARAASALNHPNIITIYEIGQAGDRHYIATEYVDGETLRRRVKRAPFGTVEALDVAAQIASALAAAHAKGIIHRDIKPENVMLRPDGYVKVLDFGLAKLLEKSGRPPDTDQEAETMEMHAAHTNPGAVMGTAWYMSPEQARGLPLDARTDVWSLGCVLYEMLAGRPPFDGETASHVIVSIIEDEPEPLAECVPGLPAELERIVERALAKEREERYGSAGEMLEDLRRLRQRLEAGGAARAGESTVAGLHTVARETEPTRDEHSTKAVSTADTSSASGRAARRSTRDARTARTREADAFIQPAAPRRGPAKSLVAAALVGLVAVALGAYVLLVRRNAPRPIEAVAVLPFANVGGDPGAEWLSDGITESLINSLSPVAGLKVMSRNSVFRYKGRDVEPYKAGRELGVAAVLAGRVAQRGDGGLVVSVELIDTRDNTQMWGEQYTRPTSDVLVVQEEIARDIAARLRSRLRGGGEGDGPKHYTKDNEAYQDYLRGRYFWNKRSADGFRRAVQYFNRAIERDPSYALAYAGLADTYALMSDYSIVPPREAMPKAKAAALRAIELDETLSEAHTSLAFVHMAFDWAWGEAESDFRRAIELNPNYATAHQWYASYLVQVGRSREALAEIRRAQELDPLSAIISANAGLYLYYARDYDAATEQLRKTLEVDEQFGVAHLYLGYVYLQQAGRADEAVAELQKAVKYMGEDPETLSALGHAYAVAGRRAEAVAVLTQLRALRERGYVSPYFVAVVHAGLGDLDPAFAALEESYRDRHPGMILLKSDPRFDPLRKDARFSKLIRRIEQPS